jgi:hypothetical protein
VFVAGCASESTTPLAPTVTTPAVPAPTRISTPTPESPVNDQRLAGLSATTLVATAATVESPAGTPQYRFQLFNDKSTLVADSGLMGEPTWKVAVTLTPLARYLWKVRAEYQGLAGDWSSVVSFMTPEQPPAYNKPIGPWEHCAGLRSVSLVRCVWDAVRPIDSVGDFEVVKRVAWLLRGEGGGLLIKETGENTVRWQGYSFSATRICFPNGHIYKLISDAGPGGANSPTYSDNDFVEKSLYVPAIDPRLP